MVSPHKLNKCDKSIYKYNSNHLSTHIAFATIKIYYEIELYKLLKSGNTSTYMNKSHDE